MMIIQKKVLIFCNVILSFFINSCDVKEKVPIIIEQSFLEERIYLFSKFNKDYHDKGWKWNYLVSYNSRPDTIGTEFYSNISSEIFEFNGQKTLPCLNITTKKNIIVEFSVDIIFNKDYCGNSKTLNEFIKQLETLLPKVRERSIRNELLDDFEYRINHKNHIEEYKIKFKKSKFSFDRFMYKAKVKHD